MPPAGAGTGPRHCELLGRGARAGRTRPVRPGRRPCCTGRGPPAAGTGDLPADRRSRDPRHVRRTRGSYRYTTVRAKLVAGPTARVPWLTEPAPSLMVLP